MSICEEVLSTKSFGVCEGLVPAAFIEDRYSFSTKTALRLFLVKITP